MDYGKYKYEQIKKERKQKSKCKQKEMKEIRISPRIGKHDFLVKVKRAEKFLLKNHKLKLVIVFKGRELSHKESGKDLLNSFIIQLSNFGKPESNKLTQERNTLQTTLIPNNRG